MQRVRKQLVAVLLEQGLPTVLVRNRTRLVVRRLGQLVRHLREQQICHLLDVVAITHPVVAQEGTVVPERLDDGCRAQLESNGGNIVSRPPGDELGSVTDLSDL